MGYGAQANNIIKANRALLKKKRTFREIKGSYMGYANEHNLKFKELSEFEQKKIRDKIITDAKKEQKRQLIASFFSVVLLGLFFYGLFLLFMELLKLP